MVSSFNTSLSFVAAQYIKLLKLRITGSSIKQSIEENSYYPSLLSLSDAFSKYNIANDAYEIEEESINQLQAPFIAFMFLDGIGEDFVLVTEINSASFKYVYNSTKPVTISRPVFLEKFKKIVFIAEPGTESVDYDYDEKLRKEKLANYKKYAWSTAAILITLLTFIANIPAENVLSFGIIALIKITGLVTAVLLLLYEVNKSNAFVKNICSAFGKANCDAVLTSKGSKLWGISWAEFGFFYFAATTLILLMPAFSFGYKTALLSIFNGIAAPYILFSIYYQWRIIKQWCPLCLVIQATLATELIWAVTNYWQYPALPLLNTPVVLLSIACMGLPVIAWFGLKQIFFSAKESNQFKKAYKRLQHNPEIFNSLLVQQAKGADNWQPLGITIGNPDAQNTIIKVCNPYCGPCANMHPKLEKIIAHNKNVNLKIIFTSPNEDNNAGTLVVKHLLAVALTGDNKKTQQALDDWYLPVKKDYEVFAGKYHMNGELKMQGDKVEAMSKWCQESAITHTPTIFVNGYRLPEHYNVEELEFIL